MAGKVFLSRFTPSRTDPEVLEKIFVQREALLKDAEERIHESAVSGNKHHLLLIGPRGSGKTLFVALMAHRLSHRDALRDRLRIAWLAEDETTTSFLKLLLRIYRALGERYPEEFPTDALEPLYAADDQTRVKLLSRLLVKKLGGRTLLVIVENLDELFKGLGAEGQQEWRALLQEHPVFATLATSQQLFDGVSLRESPFYGHFQIEHLKPLALEEAVLLLRKIADLNGDAELSAFLRTATGRNRVRALHHLSGGNHRIYIVLSDFITAESLDELIGPFEKMLDELTPYYQARLNWLSPQQREIVEDLCGRTQPVPVKEIARALFVSHQTATGQLKELREKGYVTGHAWGRESRYELSEPLMRLCVEVKENRRQPMRLIVDFLRIWYSRDQLQERLRSLPEQSVAERVYVQHAIQQIDSHSDDPRVRAILSDLERARQAAGQDEVIRLLEELAETRGEANDWFSLGYERGEGGRHEEALAAFDKALALKPDNAFAWNNRGSTLRNLGRYEEALAAFDKALALKPDNAFAWNNRGSTLRNLGRYEEALAANDNALALKPDHASAWNNRGNTLNDLGRYEEALAACDKALVLKPDNAIAWNNRGNALDGLGRYEEALAAYDKALAFQPDYASPWNNRGNTLSHLGHYEKALAAYDQALALRPDNAFACYNRVEPILSLKGWEEGFATLRDCLRRFPPATTRIAGDTKAVVGIVLGSTLDHETWRSRVTRMVQIYAEGAALGYLGDGLIRSLALPAVRMLNPDALTAWRDVWFEAGAGHDELRIPLRIFDVGIRYLRTGDRRVLLDLLSEERQILGEALGLESPAE